MTSEEYIDQLRALERQLRSAQVQSFVKRQDADSRARFVAILQDISVRLGQLTNAELDSVSRALARQDDDISAGIRAAQEALGKLENISKVLDGIGEALKVATKVAGALT